MLNVTLIPSAVGFSGIFACASSHETTRTPRPETAAKTSADPTAPTPVASLPHPPTPRHYPANWSESAAHPTTPADRTALRFCIVLARAGFPVASGKLLLPGVLSPGA